MSGVRFICCHPLYGYIKEWSNDACLIRYTKKKMDAEIFSHSKKIQCEKTAAALSLQWERVI